MKAIILVAGVGAKLRPHTYTQPKALIPIAGKTILSFIVDQLHDIGGVNEFIFIIGYMGEKIKDYVKATYPDLKCYFVHQNERQGTGHAVDLTRNIVGNEEVFVALGDTICEYDIKEVMKSPYSMLGVEKVDDPQNFGVAEIDNEGFIAKVVEKPDIPKSNKALVGLYKIKETEFLFSCLHEIFKDNIQSNGQFSLTDAIDCMIQRGARIKSFKVKNWFDCGKKDTLLQNNATLLKQLGGNVSGNEYCAEHAFKRTIIIPPVNIGPYCDISDSIIGPHVSIGANTSIKQSIIRESIIGSYTSLYDVVLKDSLIGSDASVKGLSRSLNIGDNTEIDFG